MLHQLCLMISLQKYFFTVLTFGLGERKERKRTLKMLLSKILVLVHFYWVLVFVSPKIKLCKIRKIVLQNQFVIYFPTLFIAACAAYGGQWYISRR